MTIVKEGTLKEINDLLEDVKGPRTKHIVLYRYISSTH